MGFSTSRAGPNPLPRRIDRQHTRAMTEPRQSIDRGNTNAILLWVGIAAGVVFIVAVVFFSGFFIGRHSGGFYGDRYHDMYPGMMFPNRPGQYGPMGPGMMSPQPSATTAPSPTR